MLRNKNPTDEKSIIDFYISFVSWKKKKDAVHGGSSFSIGHRSSSTQYYFIRNNRWITQSTFRYKSWLGSIEIGGRLDRCFCTFCQEAHEGSTDRLELWTGEKALISSPSFLLVFSFPLQGFCSNYSNVYLVI